jgi:hypothetical protein
MSSGSGEFTGLFYDNCEFQGRMLRSNGPGWYQLQREKYVNCNRCQVNQPNYVPLIDTESELKGITRLGSKCDQFKYSPNCKFSKSGPNTCLSTYSSLVPISLPPEVCPDSEAYLYFNNGLLRPTNPGPRFPNPNICSGIMA